MQQPTRLESIASNLATASYRLLELDRAAALLRSKGGDRSKVITDTNCLDLDLEEYARHLRDYADTLDTIAGEVRSRRKRLL